MRQLVPTLAFSLSLFSSLPAMATDSSSQNPVRKIRSPLTHTLGSHSIHVLPRQPFRITQNHASKDKGPLIYTRGGEVMTGNVTLHAIYWIPDKLQDGSSTELSDTYMNLQNQMLDDFFGHGLSSNLTQYYQTIQGVTTYISGKGSFDGAYIHRDPFPESSCQASNTPDNCMTDADIQTEIQKLADLNGWQGGMQHLYMIYTSKGEDICDDSSKKSACANADWCGYHGHVDQNPPILYAVMPYGDPDGCGYSKSPNQNPEADATLTTASHEISEAMTDPIDAWASYRGNEIADLCDNTGTGRNTWLSGRANQMWNGHYYALEQEYNNHTKTCVNAGP